MREREGERGREGEREGERGRERDHRPDFVLEMLQCQSVLCQYCSVLLSNCNGKRKTILHSPHAQGRTIIYCD